VKYFASISVSIIDGFQFMQHGAGYGHRIWSHAFGVQGAGMS